MRYWKIIIFLPFVETRTKYTVHSIQLKYALTIFKLVKTSTLLLSFFFQKFAKSLLPQKPYSIQRKKKKVRFYMSILEANS